MGVRQSATIIFAEDMGRRSEKKIKELENGRDTVGGKGSCKNDVTHLG